jgi:dihydroflavonol-4-reductase
MCDNGKEEFMKKAFITGAAGFVGLNLIEELSKDDWEIFALYLPGEDISHLSQFTVQAIAGDILNMDSLLPAIPEKVDVVFHLAGDTSTWSKNNDRQYRVNVEGTAKMLDAAIEKKAGRFIYTSSISAFGFHDGPVSEETVSTALQSGVNYHKTKFLAEQEVKKRSGRLRTVILNPCNVIGPYDRINWAQTIQAVYRDRLSGFPPGTGTFAHVKDIVRAHIQAAEKEGLRNQYVLGGTQATFREAFDTIAELLNKKRLDKALSKSTLRAATYFFALKSLIDKKEPLITLEKYKRLVGRQIIDDRRAVKDLDLKKSPLKKMFADSYAWLVQENLLKE